MKIRPRILRRITPAEWRGNMANVISDETIEYVGILAKLELSDEEKEAAKKDMASMLDHIDKLNELDTTGVEPMSHVFPVKPHLQMHRNGKKMHLLCQRQSIK